MSARFSRLSPCRELLSFVGASRSALTLGILPVVASWVSSVAACGELVLRGVQRMAAAKFWVRSKIKLAGAGRAFADGCTGGTHTRAAALALLVWGLLAAPLRASDEVAALTWRGKKLDVAALPSDLPGDARVAVESFAGWAAQHGYRLDLDDSARALLVSAKDSTKYLKRIESVLALADRTFEGREAAGTTPAAGAATEAETGSGATPAATPAAWGSGSRAPGTGTLVLCVVRTPKDHAPLLARLAELSPYLAGWAKTSTPAPGFALEEPLAGAVVLGLPANKEWNADNELVHRAAELAFHRRFGRQPYWMVQGFAWHVEMELCRGIYCFPYREGFVWATEHTGWRARFAKLWRDKPAPSLADLATLRRGQFEPNGALCAWAALAYLSDRHGVALAGALHELHELWDKNSRRDLGGGAWERLPTYELPLAEQQRILESRLAPDLGPAILGWASKD